MSEKSLHLSKEIRKESLKMVFKAKASHIGGALSMADLLAVLYEEILNLSPENVTDENRDRFLLSKGHACTGLYAVLALKKFISMNDLKNYSADDSLLLSHASHKVNGVELSTGSLGHALPVACGIALAAKRKNKSFKIYCMLSDGELDEGSNWEAILFAPIGSAREVPVIEGGQVKAGWRMKATISVDHRVSDGAEAAQFMQKLAEFLESPVRMLV